MKIDSEIRVALERAIEANSNRYQFSLKVGIPQQTIGRWLSGRTTSITDDAWNRVHPYLKPYMGTVAAPQVPPAAPPTTPDTIRNTPELRECIKDAMLREGVASAADLNRLIGYDSVHTLERLLSGKLNWFPDILSAVAEALGIDHDSLPISPAERMQLLPAGYFGDGAMLVRPIPVVSWANAAGHLDLLANPDTRLFSRWDPENTETVPAPVGTRKGTQAFRVTGISMEPTIMDDDIILVEQRMSLDEVPNNKIVVARLTEGKFEDCVVCKRLRRQGGHCWLTSDNPAGMVIPVEPSDLQWLGIVVRKQSEL
ncbi:S24 family peptidase [Victivallis vadensis]|uniref:S24 family peptidase n=1 Tax=Victivallis vadensis TaxID=172901 RepID=UPI0023F00325|nr:S24 family peptidase [Victivallis vadensis]